MPNPYAVPNTIENDRGVFADHARLRRGGFLYREIEFDQPFQGRFVYDGWWFRQRITINGARTWFRISWLTIFREAEFHLPVEVDRAERRCRIEIGFTRGLTIQRFRVWLDEQLIYDEIN